MGAAFCGRSQLNGLEGAATRPLAPCRQNVYPDAVRLSGECALGAAGSAEILKVYQAKRGGRGLTVPFLEKLWTALKVPLINSKKPTTTNLLLYSHVLPDLSKEEVDGAHWSEKKYRCV